MAKLEFIYKKLAKDCSTEDFIFHYWREIRWWISVKCYKISINKGFIVNLFKHSRSFNFFLHHCHTKQIFDHTNKKNGNTYDSAWNYQGTSISNTFFSNTNLWKQLRTTESMVQQFERIKNAPGSAKNQWTKFYLNYLIMGWLKLIIKKLNLLSFRQKRISIL